MLDMPKRLQIGATTAVVASSEIVSDLAPFIEFNSSDMRVATKLEDEGVKVTAAPSMLPPRGMPHTLMVAGLSPASRPSATAARGWKGVYL